MEVYEIIRSIGSGTFGRIQLSRHKLENRNQVIKKIKIRDMSTTDRNNTEQEIRLLQKFSHPFIVAYKDSFLDRDQQLNIVMTQCDDGDMYCLIKLQKGNLFSEEQICSWLVQMALALFQMHEKRILHRDLKTQNVFLKKGRVKLGDFGIAKVLDDTRDFANTCIGTPYYMSPELFKNKPYSYKSDIWALGCVLQEMCNLRTAFEAQSLNGLAMKILKGNQQPIHKNFSKELRELIGSMLDLNAGKRPNITEILKRPFLQPQITNTINDITHNPIDDEKQEEILQAQARKLGIKLDNQDPSFKPKTIQDEKPKSRAMSRGKPKEGGLDNNIKERLLFEKEMLKKAKTERQKIQEKINKLEYEKSQRLNVIRDKRKGRFANHDFKNEKESKIHEQIKNKESGSTSNTRKRSVEQDEDQLELEKEQKKKLDVKSKKKVNKEDVQKEYELELSKIRLQNAQAREEAQSREKAIFRPSTGQKIEEGEKEGHSQEKVNVKRLQEDYDFEDDINNHSDSELEVIYEENEEDIAEDATIEDMQFFRDFKCKTVELKTEYKKSVLKISNLKQSLKTTIKDSMLSLDQSTLDRDLSDSQNALARHHSGLSDSLEESGPVEEVPEEDSDEIDELEQSLNGNELIKESNEVTEQELIQIRENRLAERVNLVRNKIESVIGCNLFERVFAYLQKASQASVDMLEQKTQLETMLGKDNIGLWLLFDQLIFIESSTSFNVLNGQ